MTRKCKVSGCDPTREYYARGYCRMHYLRQKRTGRAGPGHAVKPHAILSEARVLKARKRYWAKDGGAHVLGELAIAWNVSRRTVYRAAIGETRSDIKDPK